MSDSHREKMQEVQSAMREKIRSAKDKKGLMLVLTGHGKGKTTSGFGMVARAVGYGKKVAVAQFIKGQWSCGERNLLEQHGAVFVTMATGFTWDTQDKAADTEAAVKVWNEIKHYLSDPSVHMVLLDELTYMINFAYLELEEVLNAIKNRPESQHVIITGRDCPRSFTEMADTVSEVQNIKHAFDAGIKAQKGFDY